MLEQGWWEKMVCCVEAELMQALAELDEDENPNDDDAIEIPSKDKYKG